MANFLPLDKAAALTSKSEVTLRRLIKAGKVPSQKEKTLTGFIYLIDPEAVKSYYKRRDGVIEEVSTTEETDGQTISAGKEETVSEAKSDELNRPVRVAVAGESGSATEYWQKKYEMYEERYNREVEKHAQTREELGLWRGRAEQAQSMLVKILPAGNQVVSSTPDNKRNPELEKNDNNISWLLSIVIFLLGLLVIGGGVLLYLKLSS